MEHSLHWQSLKNKEHLEDNLMLRKIIRILDHVVNAIIISFCVLLMLYGGYGLWDSAQVNKQAESQNYQTYRPDDPLSFDKLKQINPEVFGWLTVEKTHIDYPLVQGSDNSKYVNTDAKGEFSLSGSLFLDCRNHKDFSDMNHIIYGHHMDKEAMFGELEYFQDETYFENHQLGKLYYEGKWHLLEFFSFLQVDAYDEQIYNTTLKNESDRLQYLEYLRSNAQYFKELSFQPEDRYVVLSTCTSTSTNGRHVLVGRISKQLEAIKTEEKK